MRKKITLRNYKKALKSIEDHITADKKDAQPMLDELNDMLDNLRSNDYFGTEGQNDPRGDGRDDW